MQSFQKMVMFEFALELVKWEGWKRFPQPPELGTQGWKGMERGQRPAEEIARKSVCVTGVKRGKHVRQEDSMTFLRKPLK